MNKTDRRTFVKVPSRGSKCFVMYNNHDEFAVFAVKANDVDKALDKIYEYCRKKRIPYDPTDISGGWNFSHGNWWL